MPTATESNIATIQTLVSSGDIKVTRDRQGLLTAIYATEEATRYFPAANIGYGKVNTASEAVSAVGKNVYSVSALEFVQAYGDDVLDTAATIELPRSNNQKRNR